MRHHTGDDNTAIHKCLRHAEQVRALRQYASAVSVAVNFNQRVDRQRQSGGGLRQRVCRIQAVEDELELYVAFQECGNMAHLVWCDSNSVKNIREAVIGKIVCFAQRGYRDRPRCSSRHGERNLNAFGSFDVRAKTNF